MRFSKLRLTGFKSFVDPTDLVIGDGLTGVVGPNGCGKSNLLEALRWVMGENRPTAMRGGGMEDVIFAGAATRPARAFAEVTLLIDNEERLAPAGFNDADTLEVVRRITRDIGSAYKANGKDVRARDVQMLFADASTGAQSPALVRQGQISELINAKPKARRRVLEDAAGIGGLYQRRHEAELRLTAAEHNLERVEDVLEQLRQQLETLAAQSKQAARYRQIGADLRRAEGMLLYGRWREAEAARLEIEAALRASLLEAAALERRVQEAVRAREGAETALPALREEEAIAGALVQRLATERDSLSAEEARVTEGMTQLGATLNQLDHDLEREAALNSDADATIGKLQWESDQIVKAQEGQDQETAEAAQAAQKAAEALADLEETLARSTEDTARLAARHQSAERLLEDSRKAEAAATREAQNTSAAIALAKETFGAAEATLGAKQEEEKTALMNAQHAEQRLIEADDALTEVQSREATARARHSETKGELNAIRSEVTALAKLLDRNTEAESQILDAITVEPGFEKALGAALADDLMAPQVDEDGPSGWCRLPNYDAIVSLPSGAAPLAPHITAPEALSRRLAHIGVVASDDGPALQSHLRPGQRLVSPEGDLWRWDGYRAWAEDAPSAAAQRLQQLNRLEILKRDLNEATSQAEGATQAYEALKAAHDEVTQQQLAARAARKEADRRHAALSRDLSQTEAQCTLLAGKVASLEAAHARYADEVKAARERLQEAEAAQGQLEDIVKERTQLEALRTDVDTARRVMIARRSDLDEVRRRVKARDRRATTIAQEIGSWQHRLSTAQTRAADLTARRAKADADLAKLANAPEDIAKKRDRLMKALTDAETRKIAAIEALTHGDKILREAAAHEREQEREASAAREAHARADAQCIAAREAVEGAAERIFEAQSVSPDGLLTKLEVEAEKIPAGDALESRIARLQRQRDALGAVNLRADEDARAVEEELNALSADRRDLEDAISELRGGIAQLNREGRERLLTAFEDVNKNFTQLFKHLFGGGDANLVMVENDDPLEAGLEIMCQPPGKKLSTLSLLSGGEQTLTALALIFGVFLTNPAPICVLDEVDAPLDDANVSRFCDLLDEMCRQTQTRFMIITHHAITMARMDRLFGVTMAEQGVSQLVSVDLKKAEAMVA